MYLKNKKKEKENSPLKKKKEYEAWRSLVGLLHVLLSQSQTVSLPNTSTDCILQFMREVSKG